MTNLCFYRRKNAECELLICDLYEAQANFCIGPFQAHEFVARAHKHGVVLISVQTYVSLCGILYNIYNKWNSLARSSHLKETAIIPLFRILDKLYLVSSQGSMT